MHVARQFERPPFRKLRDVAWRFQALNRRFTPGSFSPVGRRHR